MSSSSPSHAYSTTSASASASTTHPPKFTPKMQDRQARNKDPWTGKAPPAFGSMSDDEDDEVPERGAGGSASMRGAASASGSGSGRTHGHGQHQPAQRKVVTSAADAYESAQKRRLAATVLNSPELLQFHALSRNDSISSTRQHFTAMLCGYDIEPLSIIAFAGAGSGSGSAARSSSAAGSSSAAARSAPDTAPGGPSHMAGFRTRKDKGKEKAGITISEVVYKPFTGAFEL